MCGIGRQHRGAENLLAGRNDGGARSSAQAFNTNEAMGVRFSARPTILISLPRLKPAEMEEQTVRLIA